ncbi:MAG: 3-keto-disaccharide hydrolase [Phycisphaerales bacterium]
MLTTVLALSALMMAEPPSLSSVERAAGWRLYSGADATSVWRGYKQPAFPSKGWTVENGVIATAKGGGGGDIITNEQFSDVEMSFEFKLGEAANSGVMWRVAETDGPTYQTGPEYQLLEDATYPGKPQPGQYCGALYDLYPPSPAGEEKKTMKPVGEWNTGRIYLRNGQVQHWLNGVKIVDAHVFDDAGEPTKEWLGKIAGSKFAAMKGFGVQKKGHIAVQDHGDTELALRNVKVRDLGMPMPGEVKLFNGKDLTGWTSCLPNAKDKFEAWSVRDGVLVCKGQPIGYLRTEQKYTNFVLKLEWRFNPEKGAGNSGVLVRMIGDDKVWPKSVEAQLQSENAGDFWNIEEFAMTVDKSRTNGRNTKKLPTASPVERPIGEWNEYEIIVNKGDVILNVNGQELNRATNVEAVAGFICLQSEGAEIHFRNVRLVPLD